MSNSKIGKLFINRKNQFNPFNVEDSRYYTVVISAQPSLNLEERTDYIEFGKGSMREDIFEDTFAEVDITKVSKDILKTMYLDIQLDFSTVKDSGRYSVESMFKQQGGCSVNVVLQRYLKGVSYSLDYIKVLQPYLDINNKKVSYQQYKDLCKGIIS